MNAGGPKSLSGLCSICYTEQPKYCCPRCRTQTCSLPCYKKHQQRASCNGQRNPAAFVKKSQWATPAGIDHDYNYLKSVERHIDDAAENISDLSSSQSQNNKHASRQKNSESSLNQYLARNHIFVQRAPAGMSRSKMNRTRIVSGGRAFWTIEWIDQDSVKSIQHDCDDSVTLSQIYAQHHIQQMRAQKKLQTVNESSEPPSKKRRKDAVVQPKPDAIGSSQHITTVNDTTDQAIEAKQPPELHDTAPETIAQTLSGERSCTSTDLDVDLNNQDDPAVSNEDGTVERPQVAEENVVESHQATGEQAIASAKSITDLQSSGNTAKRYFYFHRTNVPAKSTIVVPFDDGKSLTACLTGQQMQEFPSIYVLPHSPDDLPPGFMTMQAYHESRKAARTQPSVSDQHITEVKSISSTAGRTAQPNPLQILQMLKRDLSAQ